MLFAKREGIPGRRCREGAPPLPPHGVCAAAAAGTPLPVMIWWTLPAEADDEACIMGEEAVQVPESATDQAKLVLQLQKENSELRQQLVLHQHKLFTIQAQSLAANASPMPLSPLPSTTPCSTQKKTKRPLLSGNCFSTPESRRRGTIDDTTVKDLQRTIKALEETIQRLNKDHTLQIKQKDDFIRELIIKNGSEHIENGDRRAVTRASLCKGVRGMTADGGELKIPSHRFTSPSPAAKKQRSFWETGVNSPSVSARKTRSQVKEEIPPAPSMLLQLAYHTFWFVFMLGPHVAYHILQPGFARQRR